MSRLLYFCKEFKIHQLLFQNFARLKSSHIERALPQHYFSVVIRPTNFGMIIVSKLSHESATIMRVELSNEQITFLSKPYFVPIDFLSSYKKHYLSVARFTWMLWQFDFEHLLIDNLKTIIILKLVGYVNSTWSE